MGYLGASRGHLGLSGVSGARLGAIWGLLGDILGPSCGHLGLSKGPDRDRDLNVDMDVTGSGFIAL